MEDMSDIEIVSLGNDIGPFEPFVEEEDEEEPQQSQPLHLRVEDKASLKRVASRASNPSTSFSVGMR